MTTLLPNEIARRETREIHFSTESLPFDLGPITTQCGDQHDLKVTLHLRVAVRAESVDRRAFTDLLMRNRDVATTQDVAAYLSPFLRSAIESECAKPAAAVISEDQRAALLDRVRKSLDAAAFDAGLVVLPPFQLELNSPSLQAEKQAQAQRVRAAERAAEQLAQVRHASEVMKEFAALQGAASDGKAGRLLEHIAPGDRSSVLLATLAASAAEAQRVTIIAVAGECLLFLAPDAAQPKLTTLPNLLGPLRSVRAATIGGEPRLLIGARSGVWVFDPSKPSDAVAYEDRTFQSTLGFNAAAVANDRLYATHADAGLVGWQIGKSDTPTRSQSDNGARQLQMLNDGSVVFAVGNSLARVQHGERISISGNSDRTIVALLQNGEQLLVIHEDGTVGQLDSSAPKLQTIGSFGGTVLAAALLPWAGGDRLLLARESGGVECVGLEDSVVHRYLSPYSGAVRTIVASPSVLVTVTNDRQRIMTWNPGEPRASKLDLNVTSLVHHRVADIAVTTRSQFVR